MFCKNLSHASAKLPKFMCKKSVKPLVLTAIPNRALEDKNPKISSKTEHMLTCAEQERCYGYSKLIYSINGFPFDD